MACTNAWLGRWCLYSVAGVQVQATFLFSSGVWKSLLPPSGWVGQTLALVKVKFGFLTQPLLTELKERATLFPVVLGRSSYCLKSSLFLGHSFVCPLAGGNRFSSVHFVCVHIPASPHGSFSCIWFKIHKEKAKSWSEPFCRLLRPRIPRQSAGVTGCNVFSVTSHKGHGQHTYH